MTSLTLPSTERCYTEEHSGEHSPVPLCPHTRPTQGLQTHTVDSTRAVDGESGSRLSERATPERVGPDYFPGKSREIVVVVMQQLFFLLEYSECLHCAITTSIRS